MKKTLLILSMLTTAIYTYSQQVSDNVIMGGTYANDVFYSLQNGEISSNSNTNWDIAFGLDTYGASIRINAGRGVELYTYPNGDTSDFASVNISGMSSWSKSHNSTKNWSVGAFNSGATSSQTDLGWGIYNSATHYITGDSIYVIKTLAGTYKKLWIKSLISGTYTFTYANIDGSNLVEQTIQKPNPFDKNYMYYSLDNNTSVDREPSSADWDFVATKYYAILPQGVRYGVTGILTNKGIKTREARNTDVSTALWSDFPMSEDIDEIGYDWKTLSGWSYTVENDLSYFITDRIGNIWKVIFTAFEGSSTGKIEFTKEMISAVSIEENNEINLGVYPNPTSSSISFLYDNYNSENATITIYDLQGKVVYSNEFYGNGFNKHTIDVSFLNSGIYNAVIKTETKVGSQRIVKN